MPYIFNDEIVSPLDSPPLALIQDIDVAGNFMVLRDIEERELQDEKENCKNV